ncbi:hypothetical protein [Rhizorhabdus dicambivorans]|uniref:hypothetical protein n=1 Tax=Rhizorhabdus dicambivorans TaxID=1850238 RepID=UPI00111194B7|nr:hypothetical protein [Rhizorhabdus dicambivorans]
MSFRVFGSTPPAATAVRDSALVKHQSNTAAIIDPASFEDDVKPAGAYESDSMPQYLGAAFGPILLKNSVARAFGV